MKLTEEQYTIHVEQVTYVVQQGNRNLTILDNISAQWQQPCSVALRGISGSGKSTLLSILAGLLYPTSGVIKFGNYQLNQHSEELWRMIRSRHLGYVFQAPLLISELSVLENVMTRGLIRGCSPSQLHAEACALLRDLGIESLAHITPSHLSGGEQQRVSLARALLGKPSFVLMDEPTAHLDGEARQRFIELLQKIQHEYSVGIIIATHDALISDTMNEVWSIDHGMLERTR